ncbi:exocyst complex component Sec10p [[Candida] jaroonii]|uniref:Exocyst complex component Sec10p n=1 Tax=[Candida] jaroonii TaxID=467808 RepID=A0ACA9XZY6_9ASCO|nr:exocyst complex component Sec10p [[Candida] jaroonii]
MSFSIYDLDEEIRDLLQLDNFLGGLTVNEFVEELSKDHFLKGAEVNKLEYLDPKPYIRTFESALRELKQLSNEAQNQKAHMERQVEDYEIRHSRNVLELSDQIETITQQFSKLDVRISDVTNQIDPLNTALNKISNSRDVSIETIFLIRAYHGFFTKEKYEPLETLRTSKRYEDKSKCAKTVNNLLTLARKIESPDIAKTAHCIKIIEQFSGLMETELLNEFEIALENDEFETMKEISNILIDYNGGENVIQTFVSKNEFFEEEELQDLGKSLLDDESAWPVLSDVNSSEHIKDEEIYNLLNQLKVTIKGQARIVSQVFQNPTPVLRIFIQRVYAQLIQNKVSNLLTYSLSFGALAHVRVLHMLFQMVNEFTKDLKDFFITNEFDNDNELSGILDQCFYDLFIEFTSENYYFIREKKNLEETIYNIVSKFNSYNEKSLTNKSLSEAISNLNNMDYNITPTEKDSFVDKFGFKFIEKKRYDQFKEFMKTRLDVRRSSTSLDGEDLKERQEYTGLNLRLVETIIKTVVESIARVLEIEPNRSPEYALEILEILLFDFGKMYIEGGLEVIYDNAKLESNYSKINSVQEVNFNYLNSFHLLGQILFIISSCIKKIIIPCAVNNPTIRNRMINLTNGYIKRCELSINIILSETIDLSYNKLNYYLSKQKKKDFVGDNITEDDTEACELVSEFMYDVFESLSRNLDNDNLLNVLNKIGDKFLNALLEHFKKFPVNSTGGIILTRDVIRYQSVIDKWEIPELSENFQILKEIGNLFTVHPNLINSLVTEGQLATLKPLTIRQYISKRTDFNPSYIERFFSFK